MFVQSSFNSDIWSSHSFFSELADLLDGAGCPPLETNSMDSFVEVHCVVSGDHLIDGRFACLLSLFLGHL